MTKPNWRRWLLRKEVKVWEACVLSVGLEPSSMKFERESWMYQQGTGPHIESESFPNSEVENVYKDLVDALASNLFDTEHFSAAAINMTGKGYCGVRLDEFVKWATLKVEWLDLPPELAALVLNSSNDNSAESNENKQTNIVQASDKPTAKTQDEPWIEFCRSQIDDIFQSRIASGKEATKEYIAEELVGRCKRAKYITKRRLAVSKNNVLRWVLIDWTAPKIE
jgi:hypothetical protein